MRSAFSTQDQSFQVNKPTQRIVSPNKTYIAVSGSQNGFQSINSSFNFHSAQNIMESKNISANIPNMMINISPHQIKKSQTINNPNDHSFQATTAQSPVIFAEENLNKNLSFQPVKKNYIISTQINFK